MQNVHDCAHELARALRESQQYQKYQQARDNIGDDDRSFKLISQFHQRQFEYQAKQMSGGELSDEEREELASLRSILELKPEVREYLHAEARMVQMIADVQGILAGAVNLDLPQAPSEEDLTPPGDAEDTSDQ